MVLIRGMAVLLAVATSGRPQQEPGAPATAVTAFYTAYRAKPFTGLPHGSELTRISKHLSRGLVQALRTAAVRQARCIKAHPDDKGPWVEGDLFTSNFEGHTEAHPATPTDSAGRARVAVAFGYTEQGKTFNWKDEVILAKEAGRWVIDDVRYRETNGSFTSGYGKSLRASLADKGC